MLLGRIAALEHQISDLATESTRLLRSLEIQKQETSGLQQNMSKALEEVEREKIVAGKEVERLKERMDGYGDYDEIKRELEIMKVSPYTL